MAETKTKPIAEYLSELRSTTTPTTDSSLPAVDGGAMVQIPISYIQSLIDDKLSSRVASCRFFSNTPADRLSNITDIVWNTAGSGNGQMTLIEIYGYQDALLLIGGTGAVGSTNCSLNAVNLYTGKTLKAEGINPNSMSISSFLLDCVVEESSGDGNIDTSNFVTKDENGDVTVNALKVDDSILCVGTLDVKEGYSARFWSNDNSKNASLCCDDNGKLTLDGKVVATLDDIPSGDGTSSGSSNSMPYISFGCYSTEFTVADLISQLTNEGVTTISGQPVIVSFGGMVSGTFLCRFSEYHSGYYGCEFTDLTNLKTYRFEGYSSSLSLYDNLSNGGSSGGDSAINLDHSIPVTYAELRALRDAGSLVPGMFYRITDYVCTTAQENTRATDHRFDIIIQAISNYRLSETAKADYNSEDSYFSDNNANLSAWEIKYCLDNDTTRFAWAQEFYQEITNITTQTSDGTGVYLTRQPQFDGSLDGTDYENYYYAWGIGTEHTPRMDCAFTESAIISNGDSVLEYRGAYGTTQAEIIEHEEGKGVIYYMKDEHGNECPYDFKNIQFKRYVNLENGVPEVDLQDNSQFPEEWVYTFCGRSYHIANDEWSELKDGSLENPYGHQSDEGWFTFQNNIMKPYFMIYDNDNEDYTKCGKQYLNNNVFFGWWEQRGSYPDDADYFYYYPYCGAFINLDYNCYNNTFGMYSKNIRVGANSGNNYIESAFSEIGAECSYNTFLASNLKIGDGCLSNSVYSSNTTLGDGCWGNVLEGYGLILLNNLYSINTTGEYPSCKIYKGDYEIV